MVDVVFVGFEGPTGAFHFNPPDNVGQLALVIQDGAVGGDKRDEAGKFYDVGTEFGFEFGVAGKNDEGMEMVFRQIEHGLQRFDVAVVLVDWILETGFFPINRLCPLALLRVAENPAGIMFGFNDKDAGVGDEHMINLGRAVGGGERNVVDQEVWAGEMAVNGGGDHGFADIFAIVEARDASANCNADEQREEYAGNEHE